MARVAVACCLAASLSFLLPAPARAQQGIFSGMQKGLDFTFGSMSTTTTLASGEASTTDTRNFWPALTLNINAPIYPSLNLNAGGVFELNALSTDSGAGGVTSTLTRNRPYFLLRSTNPILSPGFGYFRREERARAAGQPGVKLVNEEYATYVGWNPAGGPRSDFQFVRTHTFDGARALQDITRGFGTLISNYSLGNLHAQYRGAYLNTDDSRRNVRSRQVTHGGRVSDSVALLRKRLLWNGTYTVEHQDVRSVSGGTDGEVALPLTPFEGLSAASDLPLTARLAGNPLIIDGNLTAAAGIDLGVTSPPEDAQARNIGLDFLNRTEVNRLWIWVDRDITFEIANSFSWELYSSSDNIVWRRESRVAAAPFGPFDLRFEIDFPAITARYLKVVTRPLSAAVPEASRFPDIFITEVQAFLRSPAGEFTNRVSRTTHRVNTDVRMRVLDAPAVFYEGFYLFNGPDPFGTSTSTLSNGASVTHSFARIFSAYARAAREQGTEPRGDRSATVANATLTIDPAATFRSSLLFNSQDEDIAGALTDRRSFIVQNSAQLYRGVNLLFGVGWNSTGRETGEVSNDRLLNVSATVVPSQRVSVTLSYDDTATRRSGVFQGFALSHARRLYAAVTLDPLRSLHLVLGEDLVAITGEQTRSTHEIAANWAPFPDGALEVVFSYNEMRRPLEFGSDRNTLGAVRWRLSPRSYVNVSFQKVRNQFVFQRIDSRVFSVTVRLFA